MVENAGFGATSAAPIARRVFDYLLLGKYPSVEDIAATQLGQSSVPIGTPRDATAVALPGATSTPPEAAPTWWTALPPRSAPAGRERAAADAAHPRRDDPAMSNVFDKPSLWLRVRPIFVGFDGPLSAAVVLLAVGGLLTMYSAGFDSGTRFVDHGRNMLLALGVLFFVAQIPPQRLARLAVPLYCLGVALLVATMLFGVTKKGATRWLHVGVDIQPSES